MNADPRRADRVLVMSASDGAEYELTTDASGVRRALEQIADSRGWINLAGELTDVPLHEPATRAVLARAVVAVRVVGLRL